MRVQAGAATVVVGENDKAPMVSQRSLPDGTACPVPPGPNTAGHTLDDADKTTALTSGPLGAVRYQIPSSSVT
ncbi:hypothetical protein MAHJHV64_03180 [Mycobacterium avium subsp. hominissuis]